MSGNDMSYLPTTINLLKLDEADFTYNNLTGNLLSNYRPRLRNTSKNCLSLRDISLMSVKASQR